MATMIKDDLISLKSKLENIESQLGIQMKDLETREEKWQNMDTLVKDIIENQKKIVTLNIGGKKFATYIETLEQIPDTLFYKIVTSKKIDLQKEVFFDRSPKLFSHLLDYLRYKTIKYERFTREELEELKVEADYYEMGEISSYLEERMKEVEFVAMTFSGPYLYGGAAVAANTLESLVDRYLQTGVCAINPGWITLELNNTWDIEEIEIGGFTGNPNSWYSGNGVGASIQTSLDNVTWTTVGAIPGTYANAIVPVRLTKTSAKYLKFTYQSYIGLGFVGVKKPENSK